MEISKNTAVILKAFAIILVVAGHLGLIINGGAIGVSFFWVLSGYGMTKSWKDHDSVNFFCCLVTLFFMESCINHGMFSCGIS